MTGARTEVDPRRVKATLVAALALGTTVLVLGACSTAVPAPSLPRGAPAAQPLVAPPRAAQAPGPRAEGAATRAAPASPARGDAYRLGPGDVIDITVYNNPDLETKTAIGQDGHVSFPLIGSVALADMTPAQAGRRIAHRLDAGGFVRKPYVNILVTDYRSQTVSVLGEVNNPGAYNISRPVDITQVLAMAGGINSKGSSLVTLVRKGRDGTPSRQKVDVTRLIEDGSADPVVRNGDIVYVPSAPVFYIYGEVRNPGAYPLTSGLTVQQALSVGGGLTVRGTENGIELDRAGPDGRVLSHRARLAEHLEPGDVLQVPESWF